MNTPKPISVPRPGGAYPKAVPSGSYNDIINTSIYKLKVMSEQARTPTIFTDPLANLKVRDYYRRNYDSTIGREIGGRVAGTLEGAGTGYIVGATIASIAMLFAAPFTGGTSLAGIPAAASIGGKIGAGIGAAVGLLTSDYTTHLATVDLLRNNARVFKEQGVGAGILNTMGTIGKSMDVMSGGEALRAAIFSAVSDTDPVENILKSYGLTSSGRKLYDFEIIREELGIDLGRAPNFVIDLLGDLITDPGFVAQITSMTSGSKLVKSFSATDLATNPKVKSILDTSDTLTELTKTASKNAKMNKQLAKAILHSDDAKITNIIATNNLLKEGQQLSVETIKKFIEEARDASFNNFTGRIYEVAKGIDNADDKLTGILYNVLIPQTALIKYRKPISKLIMQSATLGEVKGMTIGEFFKGNMALYKYSKKLDKAIMINQVEESKKLFTSSEFLGDITYKDIDNNLSILDDENILPEFKTQSKEFVNNAKSQLQKQIDEIKLNNDYKQHNDILNKISRLKKNKQTKAVAERIATLEKQLEEVKATITTKLTDYSTISGKISYLENGAVVNRIKKKLSRIFNLISYKQSPVFESKVKEMLATDIKELYELLNNPKAEDIVELIATNPTYGELVKYIKNFDVTGYEDIASGVKKSVSNAQEVYKETVEKMNSKFIKDLGGLDAQQETYLKYLNNQKMIEDINKEIISVGDYINDPKKFQINAKTLTGNKSYDKNLEILRSPFYSKEEKEKALEFITKTKNSIQKEIDSLEIGEHSAEYSRLHNEVIELERIKNEYDSSTKFPAELSVKNKFENVKEAMWNNIYRQSRPAKNILQVYNDSGIPTAQKIKDAVTSEYDIIASALSDAKAKLKAFQEANKNKIEKYQRLVERLKYLEDNFQHNKGFDSLEDLKLKKEALLKTEQELIEELEGFKVRIDDLRKQEAIAYKSLHHKELMSDIFLKDSVEKVARKEPHTLVYKTVNSTSFEIHKKADFVIMEYFEKCLESDKQELINEFFQIANEFEIVSQESSQARQILSTITDVLDSPKGADEIGIMNIQFIDTLPLFTQEDLPNIVNDIEIQMEELAIRINSGKYNEVSMELFKTKYDSLRDTSEYFKNFKFEESSLYLKGSSFYNKFKGSFTYNATKLSDFEKNAEFIKDSLRPLFQKNGVDMLSTKMLDKLIRSRQVLLKNIDDMKRYKKVMPEKYSVLIKKIDEVIDKLINLKPKQTERKALLELYDVVDDLDYIQLQVAIDRIITSNNEVIDKYSRNIEVLSSQLEDVEIKIMKARAQDLNTTVLEKEKSRILDAISESKNQYNTLSKQSSTLESTINEIIVKHPEVAKAMSYDEILYMLAKAQFDSTFKKVSNAIEEGNYVVGIHTFVKEMTPIIKIGRNDIFFKNLQNSTTKILKILEDFETHKDVTRLTQEFESLIASTNKTFKYKSKVDIISKELKLNLQYVFEDLDNYKQKIRITSGAYNNTALIRYVEDFLNDDKMYRGDLINNLLRDTSIIKEGVYVPNGFKEALLELDIKLNGEKISSENYKSGQLLNDFEQKDFVYEYASKSNTGAMLHRRADNIKSKYSIEEPEDNISPEQLELKKQYSEATKKYNNLNKLRESLINSSTSNLDSGVDNTAIENALKENLIKLQEAELKMKGLSDQIEEIANNTIKRTAPKYREFYIDTETTSKNFNKNGILELAITDANGETLYDIYLDPDDFDRLKDLGFDIDQEALDVNGLDREYLAEMKMQAMSDPNGTVKSMTLEQMFEFLLGDAGIFASDSIIYAHNGAFDLGAIFSNYVRTQAGSSFKNAELFASENLDLEKAQDLFNVFNGNIVDTYQLYKSYSMLDSSLGFSVTSLIDTNFEVVTTKYGKGATEFEEVADKIEKRYYYDEDGELQIDYFLNGRPAHLAEVDNKLLYQINALFKEKLEKSGILNEFDLLDIYQNYPTHKSHNIPKPLIDELFSSVSPEVRAYLNDIVLENYQDLYNLYIDLYKRKESITFNIASLTHTGTVDESIEYSDKIAFEKVEKQLDELSNRLETHLAEYHANNKNLMQVILGKNDMVYGRLNQNYVNLQMLHLGILSNSNLELVRKVLNGTEGGELGPMAEFFKNNKSQELEELRELIDDMYESAHWLDEALADVVDDPDSLDLFYQVINSANEALTTLPKNLSKKEALDRINNEIYTRMFRFNKGKSLSPSTIKNVANRTLEYYLDGKDNIIMFTRKDLSNRLANDIKVKMTDVYSMYDVNRKKMDKLGRAVGAEYSPVLDKFHGSVMEMLQQFRSPLAEAKSYKIFGENGSGGLLNPISLNSFSKDMKMSQADLIAKNSKTVLVDSFDTKKSKRLKSLAQTPIKDLYVETNAKSRFFGYVDASETKMYQAWEKVANTLGIETKGLLNAINFKHSLSTEGGKKHRYALEIWDALVKGNIEFEYIDSNKFSDLVAYVETLEITNIEDTKELRNRIKIAFVNEYMSSIGLEDESANTMSRLRGTYKSKVMHDAMNSSSKVSKEIFSIYNTPEALSNYFKQSPQMTLVMAEPILETVDGKVLLNYKYRRIDTSDLGSLQNVLEDSKADANMFGIMGNDSFTSLTNAVGQKVEMPDWLKGIHSSFIYPIKFFSLLFSAPFVVSNATSAFFQNLSANGFNPIKTINSLSQTTKDYHLWKEVFEGVFGSEGLVKSYNGTRKFNDVWFELLSKKDKAFMEALSEYNPELLEKINSLDPDTFDRLRQLDEILNTNASLGQLNEVQRNIDLSNKMDKRYEEVKESALAGDVNAQEEFWVLNKEPNKGYGSLQEELDDLTAKRKAKQLTKNNEYRRLSLLKRYINEKEPGVMSHIYKLKFLNWWSEFNSDMETVFRASMIKDSLDIGGTMEEATQLVIDRHFIYNDKSLFEKMTEVFIPFASYPIKAAKLFSDLTSDYAFTKVMYEFLDNSWGDEDDNLKNSYLLNRKAKGDIPLGDRLYSLGNPMTEALSSIVDPIDAINNKINPFAKPFIDLAAKEKYNRISQMPVLSHGFRLNEAIQDADQNGKFYLSQAMGLSKSYFRNEHHYYTRSLYPKRSYLYKNLYTSGGNSRIEMRMAKTTTNNVKYRVNDILYQNRLRMNNRR